MVHNSSEDIHFALHTLVGTVEDSCSIDIVLKCELDDQWTLIIRTVQSKIITDLIMIEERPNEYENEDEEDDLEAYDDEELDI